MRFVWKIGLVLALLAGLALAACSPPQSRGSTGEYIVDLTVVPSAPVVGAANVIVTLQDSGGVGLAGATVQVEGNMSHAGMVPVLAEAAHQGNGRYVADFEFTMGGDWILTVRATLADGTIIQKDFTMTVRSQ